MPTSDRVARGLSQPAAVRRTAHRVVVTDNTGNLDAPWMVILHGLGGGPSSGLRWSQRSPTTTGC